ncbi:T4P13.26 protein isoform 1 [Cucumis melo var. makuwa]|uniref:T4P13.26 protein isoform 1 n=1 Tax=Cucumis melo var. makuwa TaxID=1194695 RepID=A0A5D3BQU2_CUCMM|nr:T4P13.26 protein isoform 1 [Cucumis melo var. makuwa]
MTAAIAVSSPKSAILWQNPFSRKDPVPSFLGRSFKGFTKSRTKLHPLGLIVASATSSSSSEGNVSERFYFNFTGFPFPLGPFLNRRTIRTEVKRLTISPFLSFLHLGLFDLMESIDNMAVKGSIWLFEQEQALGFSSVSTNIRMTVIKLKSGGLWVHAPIAPTKECIQLLKELDAPVEYIILPTFAYEHKIFVGPFSRKFPRAQIWVAPRQWSWPLNLPLEFLGIFGAKTLKDEDLSAPWADEIEQKVLSSPEVGIGPYVEVAFYHKRSKTLLVTDAVIFVPRQPPECISKESLLASAKNGLAVKLLSKGKEVPEEPVVDNKINRQKGWERMVLQILFLGPSNLLEPNASFAQMSQKLIVSPIVKTLVFSKVPEKVRDWIDRIVRDWKFKRIIPAHFAAPVNASSSDFLTAFGFLDDLLGERYVNRPSLSILFASLMGKAASYFPPDDMKTLSSLDQFLVSVGAVKKTVSGRKR